jgi:hypothetical protein
MNPSEYKELIEYLDQRFSQLPTKTWYRDLFVNLKDGEKRFGEEDARQI